MIGFTWNNTVCSSSKWLQKKQVIGKNREGTCLPRHPLNTALHMMSTWCAIFLYTCTSSRLIQFKNHIISFPIINPCHSLDLCISFYNQSTPFYLLTIGLLFLHPFFPTGNKLCISKYSYKLLADIPVTSFPLKKDMILT